MKVFCLATLVVLVGCARKQPPLPVYGQIPEFQLTAESGQPLDRKALDGSIWVADFIFTSCTGPCPRMSSLMRQVQSSVQTLPVKLVSFTVDPERDTPPVLASYAQRYHAEPGRWYFLTGQRSELHRLARQAFKLGDVDASLNHSTRLVLMDAKSRIRGYYGTSEDSPVMHLVADIRRLLKE